MSNRTVPLALAVTACLVWRADLIAAPKKPVARRAPAAAASLPCGDLVSFQVLLDRQGFSPGQIDGKIGANFSHAIAALQSAHSLKASGQPDCATWQAL